MARLSLTVGGEQRTFAVEGTQLRVGRAIDNDIVLNHAIVSRHHASIAVERGEVIVRDLESRNGVFVNRLRVKEAALQSGDLIQIGPFDLFYEDRAAQHVVLDDDHYLALANDAQPVSAPELSAAVLDLQGFCRLLTRLNMAVSQRELLDALIDEALRLVPAERAFLLLLRGGELVPMVVYPPSAGDLTISNTIVRQAIKDRVAVLTRDARLDFAGSDSIISQNIRSALCVPLLAQQEPIGLILLDSPGRDRFTHQQRDLLVAVASQAAIAIERARLTEELHQQAQVRSNLERFLSPNVARLVARHVTLHGKLWEAEELPVSVLFADVQGFTALSEQLRPHEVQDLLNEYLHEMTEVIFDFGGTLDKYIGDGIMAVFGAPRLPDEQPGVDHAVLAVEAALAMLAAHRRLLNKLDKRKAFNIRIGINTGPVYAGFFGTRHRLEYTALGDTVNTASRLEAAAEINGILIGEAVAAAIGQSFTLEPVGELQLRGREQPLRAFKVIGKALSVPQVNPRQHGDTGAGTS